MKTIYKTFEDGLLKLSQFEDDTWINLINPTQQEILQTSKELNIEPHAILSALDAEENARVEIEDNYTIIIVDVPIIRNEETKTGYITIPLGIILGNKFILTVCLQDLDILK